MKSSVAGSFPHRSLSTRRACALITAALAWALSLGSALPSFAQSSCNDPSVSSLSLYALGTHNSISLIKPGSAAQSTQVVNGIDGNLIGIDFRPSDASATSFYGLTDTGKLYLIDASVTPYRSTLVSLSAPRFAGGYQSLVDFNPTSPPNALRVIGSNDQNFALTGAALNQTVVQTALAYVSGDANFNVDPNITAGAYDTNISPAPSTTLYMIDYDLDTLVTIAGRNAIGSSDTRTGALKTIGSIVDEQGNAINFAPTADLDIYTSTAGVNLGFAVTGQDLYCIDFSGVNANLPVGALQKVVAQKLPSYSLEIAKLARDGLIDVAVNPLPPVQVANQADLSVSASGSSSTLNGRVSASYLITVKNLGPASASSAILSSTPLACAKLSGSTAFGCTITTSQGSCTLAGLLANRISCNFGDLASGATVLVRAGGTSFSAAPGDVTSTFTALSNTLDAARGNNSADVTITFPEVVIDVPPMR